MTDNKFRKREVMARCVPMNTLQAVLSGKWKFLILWYIAFYKVQRFGGIVAPNGRYNSIDLNKTVA